MYVVLVLAPGTKFTGTRGTYHMYVHIYEGQDSPVPIWRSEFQYVCTSTKYFTGKFTRMSKSTTGISVSRYLSLAAFLYIKPIYPFC